MNWIQLDWIKRLHRDVTTGVQKAYIDQFNMMKRSELLHPANEVHLLALQRGFVTVIIHS